MTSSRRGHITTLDVLLFGRLKHLVINVIQDKCNFRMPVIVSDFTHYGKRAIMHTCLLAMALFNQILYIYNADRCFDVFFFYSFFFFLVIFFFYHLFIYSFLFVSFCMLVDFVWFVLVGFLGGRGVCIFKLVFHMFYLLAILLYFIDIKWNDFYR
jgi:hypothetical protein